MQQVQVQQLSQAAIAPFQRTVAEKYEELRAQCVNTFGEQFCEAIMGRDPIYLPARSPSFVLPWWILIGIGFVVGKVL